MQLAFAFLAKSGEMNPKGLFSVLGAGFDTLYLESFPGNIPQLCLLARVLLTPEEAARANYLQLKIIGHDGRELPITTSLPFSVDPNTGPVAGGPPRMTFLGEFIHLEIPAPGVYEFRLACNGEPLGSVPLNCLVGALPEGGSQR